MAEAAQGRRRRAETTVDQALIRRLVSLGPVDKPEPNPDRCDLHESEKAVCGLVVAGGDTAGVFELVEKALDAVSEAVDGVLDGELDLAIGLGRDHRHCAVKAGVVADVVAVVSLVAQQRERPFGGTVGQLAGDPCIVGFSGGDQQPERQAVGVGVGVEFGREAAARTAKTLAMSPPFAPAAQ